MACEYNYYDKEEKYYPRLYCKINGKQCIYSKKCLKEEKFIPLDNQSECYIANMEKKKNIPNGSCYVRFEHKGYLFVEIDDTHVVQIKNTLDNVKDYVYVRKVNNEYEISLSPFPIENEIVIEQIQQQVLELSEEKKVETKTKSRKKKNNYVKNEN